MFTSSQKILNRSPKETHFQFSLIVKYCSHDHICKIQRQLYDHTHEVITKWNCYINSNLYDSYFSQEIFNFMEREKKTVGYITDVQVSFTQFK